MLTIMLLTSLSKANCENFSSDEAIQNIASLYNQSKLIVTDFNSTGKASIANLTIPGTMTSTNGTVSGTLNTNILSANTLTTKGITIGQTQLPGSDGKNYITGPTNVLRGGPTIVQGNLQVDNTLTTTGNAKFANRVQFRVMDNAKPAGGWDINNFLVSNAADCATQCYNKYPNALSAGFSKNDKRCYCKQLMGLENVNDTNWATTFII